jgi:hypothetical protein
MHSSSGSIAAKQRMWLLICSAPIYAGPHPPPALPVTSIAVVSNTVINTIAGSSGGCRGSSCITSWRNQPPPLLLLLPPLQVFLLLQKLLLQLHLLLQLLLLTQLL